MRRSIKMASLIGNTIAVCLCLALFFGDSLLKLNRAVYDFDMKQTMSHAPHEDIIVIDIDQESLELIGTFPWSRDIYIPLLENLSAARVIAFDIMFTTNSEDPEIDEAFAETLRSMDQVIIPSYVELETFFSKETKVKKGELIQGQKLNQSIPMIASSAQTAHINAAIDEDGVIRRTWLMLDTPQGPIPSLAYRVAEIYGANVRPYLEQHPQTEIQIKYNSTTRDFMNIPFYMVLNGEVPPDTFEDRIVLIGMAAAGDDAKPTPVENHMYLVYAHANIIDQLLQNQMITVTKDSILLLVTLVTILLTIILAWRIKPVYSIGLVFLGSVLLLYGQWLMFKHMSIYFNPVYPLFALYITYFSNISIKTYFETKQKQFITRQFGRYISPELVEQIAGSGTEPPLGGVKKELSVLFLDIRGFTTLSEQMLPEEVVDFLNMMFDMITNQALKNNGTIDKFIGDAAMILFNAPLDVPNHEFYAVKTAWDIQRGMERVRQAIGAKHGVEISVGIGINTGEVVVGNIGSYLRVDYTAIGDHVNTAARIEANTEANQILVSEATYERTKAYFQYRDAGERIMKGKTVAIRLYEVIAFIQSPE